MSIVTGEAPYCNFFTASLAATPSSLFQKEEGLFFSNVITNVFKRKLEENLVESASKRRRYEVEAADKLNLLPKADYIPVHPMVPDEPFVELDLSTTTIGMQALELTSDNVEKFPGVPQELYPMPKWLHKTIGFIRKTNPIRANLDSEIFQDAVIQVIHWRAEKKQEPLFGMQLNAIFNRQPRSIERSVLAKLIENKLIKPTTKDMVWAANVQRFVTCSTPIIYNNSYIKRYTAKNRENV